MNENISFDRAKRWFLFIMLVMCTLLHGLSVADRYIPALVNVLSVMGMIAK